MKQVFAWLPLLFALGCDTALVWYHEDEAVSREVLYRVSGARTETIIVYTDEHGVEQRVNVGAMPWEYGFTAEKGTPLRLSAQRRWFDLEVTAAVRINGRLYGSDRSASKAIAAVVTGTVP